jgi:cytochrome d ubiquinol oxidase subunit I
MDLDPTFLSRLQFAFVVSFHILFPAFTIGLSAYIAVLEGLWLWTGRDLYARVSQFWIRIFAVSFGMGVVSGIVMSYQFGTNWSRFSAAAANVAGPLLTYEVMTAFFIEATFLGILLFGRNRVSRTVHFISAVMVALGTLLSSFWILSANSFMHTPAGVTARDGIFYVQSWWAAIFNPSFPYRLSHMVTAAFLTTAFAVIGVGAWYLRRNRNLPEARLMFSMTLWLVTVLAPLQILLGDLHGLNTLEHQPAKIAAMEGHWEPQTGAPFIVFALPDMVAERNHLEIGIPKASSLILTHELNGAVPGLKQWPPEDRPYVPIVFWAFRLMLVIGFFMAFIALASLVLRWQGRLFTTPWFHTLCQWSLPIGFIAILAGWTTTEVGRQPWVIQGLVRTADAVSPALTGGAVLTSLIVYVIVYVIIFGSGVYYISRLVGKGPDVAETPEPGGPSESPMRPLGMPETAMRPGE